ncbi:MAG: glycosyltransferase family 2 protein [Nanoarchaeota archaeon]|nr:glycosyltransferase family 2 protein [Nanoarchaeota archaeon]
MDKIVIAGVMGQNCLKFLPMCLESLKTADIIIYIDGGSEDGSIEYAKEKGCEIIENEYDQKDKTMNGKQRNVFLNYLKIKYLNDWCIFLDADEVLEDYGIQKLKNTITQLNNKEAVLSPRIHHFIGDLGHEDWTKDIHFVPNRFFKIINELEYTEVEHSVLQLKAKILNEKEEIPQTVIGTVDVHIWHLRECQGIFETNRKFNWNTQKSNIHSETQLRQWNRDMLFGNYPRKRVHYDQIPTPIKQRFDI